MGFDEPQTISYGPIKIISSLESCFLGAIATRVLFSDILYIKIN